MNGRDCRRCRSTWAVGASIADAAAGAAAPTRCAKKKTAEPVGGVTGVILPTRRASG